jgi:hypothetical protein
MSVRAARPKALLTPKLPCSGGCTFAEDPAREAPDARLIWHADFDPATLSAGAVAASDASGLDTIDATCLAPWLSAVVDETGTEHVVLSDGWQRIRLDIERGSLLAGDPVVLQFRLCGIESAEPKLLPIRRLAALIRHRRFLHTLAVPDARIGRLLLALRVHDALEAGASQREIAEQLFGSGAAAGERADSLRSRVRRLVREARRLSGGGWRMLMRRRR